MDHESGQRRIYKCGALFDTNLRPGSWPLFISVPLFSEHELTFTFAIMLSPVRVSVCLSSVTLVRPTQAVQIFVNFSTAFGTLAIH